MTTDDIREVLADDQGRPVVTAAVPERRHRAPPARIPRLARWVWVTTVAGVGAVVAVVVVASHLGPSPDPEPAVRMPTQARAAYTPRTLPPLSVATPSASPVPSPTDPAPPVRTLTGRTQAAPMPVVTPRRTVAPVETSDAPPSVAEPAPPVELAEQPAATEETPVTPTPTATAEPTPTEPTPTEPDVLEEIVQDVTEPEPTEQTP